MQNVLRMQHYHYFSPEFKIEEYQEVLEQQIVYLELSKARQNWAVVQETERYIGELIISIESAKHSRN